MILDQPANLTIAKTLSPTIESTTIVIESNEISEEKEEQNSGHSEFSCTSKSGI